MNELTQQIDDLLRHTRPDRYDPTDRDWQRPVIELIAEQLTEQEARRQSAELLVRQRETVATRKANKFLQALASDQPPFCDALDLANEPISVGKERVRLGACTGRDLIDFADELLRKAANDFAGANQTANGARRAGRTMITLGISWAELSPDQLVDESDYRGYLDDAEVD